MIDIINLTKHYAKEDLHEQTQALFDYNLVPEHLRIFLLLVHPNPSSGGI